MTRERHSVTFWSLLGDLLLWLYARCCSLLQRLSAWCRSRRGRSGPWPDKRRKIMELKTYGHVGEPPEIERLYRNFPGLNGRTAAPAVVGQDLWDRVSEANRRVNGAIRYNRQSPSDWAGPKAQEHISGLTGKPVTTLVGNCRDFVITKMLELQAAGVPRGAMRIADAQVREPGGRMEHHLVLLLQQEDGRAWILDNRTPEIYDWPGLPTYEWGQVEQPGRSEWGRLTPAPTKPVGLDEVLRQTASGVPGDGV